MVNMLISVAWLLAALGICGAAAGLMIGSLFTLSGEILRVAALAGGALTGVAGLGAALVRQSRGGPPLYARGVMHGYVVGVPEMEFGCLSMVLVVVGAFVFPLL